MENLSIHLNRQMALKLMGEQIKFSLSGVCFRELTKDIKIDSLHLSITNYRIIIFHPSNDHFYFEIYYKDIKEFETKTRGWISKTCYRLDIFHTNGEQFKIKKMDRGEFKSATEYFEQAYNKREWVNQHIVSNNHLSETFKLSKSNSNTSQ